MGLFRNSRGIAIWNKQTIAKAIAKPHKQRRGMLFYREKSKSGGVVLNKRPLEKSVSSG